MNKLLKLIVSVLLLTLINAEIKAEGEEKSNPNTNAKYFQTIRGTIIDQDAKIPLIGATVIVVGSDPIMGASTDYDGNFRIDNVPVGRVNLEVSSLGYEKKMIPNIVVGSGKEVVLNVEIVESIVKLDDITVKAKRNKAEALNEMATVSAKVFTVEETKRYAGSFNDPARMVAAFAGVAGDPSGNNDIIVRGNSPKGILWILEGIEIPNPNHFANEGSSGGKINALNSAMLSNSDFFSGAFAPEYGNAFSGVFDMKLRAGNNEKREYSFSGGALGMEGTMEGPFKNGYGGSYLINYRYSSLAILDNLGMVNFYGVPKYQDLSFKIVLPTNKAGNFEIFGLGGKSSIYSEDVDENNEDYVFATGDWSAKLGIMGLIHTYQINEKTYIKNIISTSGTQSGRYYSPRDTIGNLYEQFRDDNTNTSVKFSTTLNSKINAQHRVKAGVTYSDLGYKLFAEYDDDADGVYTPDLDKNGRAGLVQAYVNWKYRMTDDLTMVSGIHYMHFLLNDSKSIEPRMGLEYRINPQQAFTLGFGIHSKVNSISTYFAEVENEETNTFSASNKDLGLSKAMHFVAGYNHQFTQNLHLKTEIYYQHLYDVPVENDPTSSYVLLNNMGGWSNTEFVNKGLGRNYGLELTLERFYHNRFYYLATASLYQSEFKALGDDDYRSSRFNGNYISNFLIGKEFQLGNKEKNRTLAVNAKVTLLGGSRYTPLDIAASREKNEGVYNTNEYLAKKADDVFKTDVSFSYRRDRKHTTHEFKIDLQNVTNNQAVVEEYWDDRRGELEYAYQWAFIPNVIYTIQF
ncbi:MAG: TonB-dependent receptor [Salinivirgaceae bacterium]|nr:TonB-dependent receptor [Salinivirgaceae bacterium]